MLCPGRGGAAAADAACASLCGGTVSRPAALNGSAAGTVASVAEQWFIRQAWLTQHCQRRVHAHVNATRTRCNWNLLIAVCELEHLSAVLGHLLKSAASRIAFRPVMSSQLLPALHKFIRRPLLVMPAWPRRSRWPA